MQSAKGSPLIQRRALRQDVERVLRERIVDGRLAGGERLEEVRLTAELGVSRTPLREALLALECSGLVRSEMNKGFTVVPFDARTVEEVYPIVGALEALAVRDSKTELQPVCPELRKINQRIRKGSRDPAVLYRLDLEWHGLLWDRGSNPRLANLIRSHKDHMRRFDGASRRGLANMDESCDQHDAITALIQDGDLDAAADHLERHWRSGKQTVLRWLEKHPRDPG